MDADMDVNITHLITYDNQIQDQLKQSQFQQKQKLYTFCSKQCKSQTCQKIHIDMSIFSSKTRQMLAQIQVFCQKQMNCKNQMCKNNQNIYHFNKEHLNKISIDLYKKQNLIYYVTSKQPLLQTKTQKFSEIFQKTKKSYKYISNQNNIVQQFINKKDKSLCFGKKARINNSHEIKSIIKQSWILNTFTKKNMNKNIIQFKGLYRTEKNQLYMILQKGDISLSQYRKHQQSQQFQNIIQIFCNILNGLQFIHQFRYHLDIKPQNIVRCKDTKNNYQWKIIDFQTSVPKKREKTKSKIGTYGYIAPQMQKNQIVSDKNDIYSLGATIISLIYHRSYSQLIPQTLNEASQKNQILYQICKKMTLQDPKSRPSIQQIKNFPIIKQYNDNFNIKNHFVFCLDTSGSMQGQPWNDLVTAFHNFKKIRIQNKKQLDRVSVILFNHKAKLMIETQKWQKIISDNVLQFFGGGTNFGIALQQAQRILLKNAGKTSKSTLIFMSDGFCQNGEIEAKRIESTFFRQDYSLTAAFLSCGNSANQGCIQKLCNVFENNGLFYRCEKSMDLIKYFTKMSQIF